MFFPPGNLERYTFILFFSSSSNKHQPFCEQAFPTVLLSISIIQTGGSRTMREYSRLQVGNFLDIRIFPIDAS